MEPQLWLHSGIVDRYQVEEKDMDLDIFEFGKNGPPVVFLHGGPGAFGYMEKLCQTASVFCNPIHYNQRGSKQTNTEIGISDHISDLKSVLSRYSNESKPILVGHSWGAMLAVLFAGEFSDRIKKLILLGCGPLNKKQGNEFLKILQQEVNE